MGDGRRYEQQNPWISFRYAVSFAPLWAKLGEAYSKCKHLSGTPLKPALQRDLSRIYMIKGALASTAIEGNTLSEAQVMALREGKEKLPPSQRYLEQEVDNVLGALKDIDSSGRSGERFRLSPEWIKDQNRKVLDGLEVEDYVVPGEYCTGQMVVGSYRGAPPEDVPYLMDRLCEWLNTEYLEPADACNDDQEDMRFYLCFLAAVLAHLYLVWIHGFGDGNGRTARLVETAILDHSGVVPWISANTLADYYNQTRDKYYLRLSESSRNGDASGFVHYSAVGFVEKLRDQIERVQDQQRKISWESLVYEVLRDEPSGAARDRRRDVVIAMSNTSGPLERQQISQLTPRIAAKYGNDETKRARMLSRDLKRLAELGLVRREGRGMWTSNITIMDAFKPV